MADTVETVVYRMGVEGQAELDAADASAARLAVSEEKLTRATRNTADSVDRLLGRLDPRIRAEQQLQAALAQVNRFEEEGIGTAAQRAQAIDAATTRYNQAIQKLNGTQAQNTFLGAGNAAKLSAFQLQNLSFQLQDVGQAVATGQPLFRTFIQQGSQIAQIFGPGVGVAGALRAVGTGIVTYLTNPLNVAVLAFSVATLAAGALFNAISGGKGESAADMLKRHKELIDQITKAYGEATNASRGMAAAQENMLRSGALLAQIENTKALAAESKRLRDDFGKLFQIGNSQALLGGIGMSNPFANWKIPQGFIDDARKFREDFAKGVGDVEAYRRNLDRLGQEFPTSENLAFIASEKAATQAAADLVAQQRELAIALNGTDASLRNLAQGYAAMATIAELQRQQQAALQGISARSPGQKAAAASAAVLAGAPDANDPTGAVQTYKAQAAAALVLATATQTLSEAQRERLRSLDETILASKQDLELIGAGIRETAALGMEHKLTAALRAEAAKNGIGVSQQEIEAIKAASTEYGKLAQKIAETNALRDLAFTRGQTLRSPTEQSVATTLRGIYGDNYEQEMNGAIAAQIRLNDQIKLTHDLSVDFVTGFVSDLRQGVGVVESLGNAFGRLGDKLLDIALNNAINALLGNLLGGGLGGLFGGSSAATGAPLNLLAHNAAGNDNWSGGPTWVGENGPEVVNLPRGAQIIPAHKAAAAINGGGGVSVTYAPTYNVQGSGPEIDALRQEIAKDRAEAPQRIVETVRDAQSRRMIA